MHVYQSVPSSGWHQDHRQATDTEKKPAFDPALCIWMVAIERGRPACPCCHSFEEGWRLSRRERALQRPNPSRRKRAQPADRRRLCKAKNVVTLLGKTQTAELMNEHLVTFAQASETACLLVIIPALAPWASPLRGRRCQR